MSEDNEEDDYMSDKFLTGMVEKDIRPGLIYNRSHKRSHENLKQREKILEESRLKKISKKTLQSDRLNEGLGQPIASSNKGFALLQKMGFNFGTGLGKSGEGRTEPIPIELKNDRYGLGRKTALKEVAAMKLFLTNSKQKRENNCTESFLSRIKDRMSERAVEIDLYKSQRTCFQLDTKHDISEPGEPWFWPSKDVKDRNDVKNDDEENNDGEEKPKFNESNDSNPSEEDEQIKEDENSHDTSEDDDAYEFSAQEKLQVLTLYLRRTYFFCIWCGTQYDDEKDLQSECPGSEREDH